MLVPRAAVHDVSDCVLLVSFSWLQSSRSPLVSPHTGLTAVAAMEQISLYRRIEEAEFDELVDGGWRSVDQSS